MSEPGPILIDVWATHEQERSGAAPIGAIALGPDGARLVGFTDAALAAVVAAIAAEPHLPLPVRRTLSTGGRFVDVRRIAPADPDYPRAFAHALGRRTHFHASGG